MNGRQRTRPTPPIWTRRRKGLRACSLRESLTRWKPDRPAYSLLFAASKQGRHVELPLQALKAEAL